MKDVRGKSVIITGGAMGMGKLWAQHFVNDGAQVILWDINQDALTATEKEFRNQGHQVSSQVVDVTDRELVYKHVAELEQKFANIDVLVNNAGIVAAGPYLEVPDEKLAATIQVDLMAQFWTMKAVLPGMLKKGEGHIVNVSSAAGFIGVPYMPAYCAAKWGVIGMTESLRLEMEAMGQKNIKFTLVCPSYVDTGMFDGAKPPMLTKMLTPEEIVKIAYNAFKSDQFWVIEPWLVKLTPLLKALLPGPVFDAVSNLLGADQSMTEWKGHGQ